MVLHVKVLQRFSRHMPTGRGNKKSTNSKVSPTSGHSGDSTIIPALNPHPDADDDANIVIFG